MQGRKYSAYLQPSGKGGCKDPYEERCKEILGGMMKTKIRLLGPTMLKGALTQGEMEQGELLERGGIWKSVESRRGG